MTVTSMPVYYVCWKVYLVTSILPSKLRQIQVDWSIKWFEEWNPSTCLPLLYGSLQIIILSIIKLLFNFSIINLWKDTGYHHILCPHTAFPIVQYELYRDPGKRNVNCRFTVFTAYNCFHIHKILSILNALSIYGKDRKKIEKNVHRGWTYEQFSSYCFKTCVSLIYFTYQVTGQYSKMTHMWRTRVK